MNLIDQIQNQLASFTPAERAVAELVLADPVRFQRQAVLELAERAGVSSPTVVRFCRSMQCKGLSEFKLKLAACTPKGVEFVHQAVQLGDSGEAVVHKVFDKAIQTLDRFRVAPPMLALRKASQTIQKCVAGAGRLVFIGVGNSGFVAHDAQHKFFRMGCHAQAHTDGHLQVMASSLLGKGDCLVVFSNSGRSRDLLDACRIAKTSKVPTVAITAAGSPLAKVVDVCVPANHDETYEQYSPMVSRLLHLCIVDVLATEVSLGMGKPLQKDLARLKKNLIESRYVK